MKDEDPFGAAFPLLGDNKAALQMAKNPAHHKKGKHIHLAFNLTREEVYKGSLAPAFIPTGENPADLMTKYLSRDLFNTHMARLGQEIREGSAENGLEMQGASPGTPGQNDTQVKAA